ncbi:uncharacterized protein LOC120289565 [Eucalyptus grandis]|uniref:uncharacterized protein LOC120289565 n=1 Tax=Eucalyptus grandis TaxID=71139 RepID=UPI00192F059D|nr:uncharacterized protein LOC120289565 [Eucalyptus grandis]
MSNEKREVRRTSSSSSAAAAAVVVSGPNPNLPGPPGPSPPLGSPSRLGAGPPLLRLLSAIGVSLELHRLEIEPALSRFLTDVVPQFIDDAGGGEGCGHGSVEKEGELSSGAKERLGCCSTSKPAAREAELSKISSENFVNEKGAQGMAAFQLETPELGSCLVC